MDLAASGCSRRVVEYGLIFCGGDGLVVSGVRLASWEIKEEDWLSRDSGLADGLQMP